MARWTATITSLLIVETSFMPLSTTATILSGLEHTILDLATRSSLRIDMVGADPEELLAQRLNENILHYCPNLIKLTIRFVGPSVLKGM